MTALTRRTLLKLLSCAPGAALLAPLVPARTHSRPSVGTLNLGLFFDESDVPRIRKHYNEAPRFARLRKELADVDYAGEYAFLENELRYNDQLFHVARLGNNIQRLSFLYLMTGSEEARDLAVTSVRELMKFERWDFFLDGDKPIGVQRAPLSTVAVSVAADWLGDALSEEERRTWLHAMAQKGCEACYGSLYGIRNPMEVVEWRFDPESTYFEHRPDNRTDMNRRAEITQDTNLRAVPASALVIGATAQELEFGRTASTERWQEMGAYSVRAFENVFAPDGSYNEETAYANYTAEHIAQAAIVSARHGGANLLDVVNWDGYTEFQLNMTMPTDDDPYGVVNFGDSGNRSFDEVARAALPTWIAAHAKNGLAQWFGTNRAGIDSLWSAMWYDPAITPTPPTAGPRLWVSGFDRIVARTGWSAKDLVVAMRSGPPSNHEHADRNSMVVKAYGQRLISDPLRPPYSFADPAWPMRLTQGHSAILIDGHGHEHHNGVEGTNASRSYARITKNEATDKYALWTSVATQAYRLVDLQIKDVIRSVVVLFEEEVVVVADRVSKYEDASSVTARFFGDNTDGKCSMRVGADGFFVRRPGAVLRAHVASDAAFGVQQGEPFVPVETARMHPFVDVVTAPANELVLVTVMAVADVESNLAPTEIDREGSEVSVSTGSRHVRITGDGIAVE